MKRKKKENKGLFLILMRSWNTTKQTLKFNAGKESFLDNNCLALPNGRVGRTLKLPHTLSPYSIKYQLNLATIIKHFNMNHPNGKSKNPHLKYKAVTQQAKDAT